MKDFRRHIAALNLCLKASHDEVILVSELMGSRTGKEEDRGSPGLVVFNGLRVTTE
jgi:hypothetical protein